MRDSLELLLAMLVCGGLTFAARASFLLYGDKLRLGPRFRALLAYVPPSVLAALIAPELFVGAVQSGSAMASSRLWAAVAAALVALYFRSVLATIAVGMLVLWLLQRM